MKHECSVVRDLLPLYVEQMVSEETGAFIKEHLANCAACAAELDGMKAEAAVEKVGGEIQNDLEKEVRKSLQAIRKKFRKNASRVAAVAAAIVVAICVLLHIFPVYRLAEIGLNDYYTAEQMAKAIYIGSVSDRREVQAVLRLADKAFHDTRHTRAENEAAYGLLARYASHTDSYGEVAFCDYSLELWSAHLEEDEGWIWVYYSAEAFRHDGSTAHGSWRIPSLWRVEKSDSGEWVVVQIREHP